MPTRKTGTRGNRHTRQTLPHGSFLASLASPSAVLECGDALSGFRRVAAGHHQLPVSVTQFPEARAPIVRAPRRQELQGAFEATTAIGAGRVRRRRPVTSISKRTTRARRRATTPLPFRPLWAPNPPDPLRWDGVEQRLEESVGLSLPDSLAVPARDERYPCNDARGPNEPRTW